MVLPAFYTLAQRKLLPERWLLVGNGRGDVAHEDFRAHVHRALTQFGPQPADGPWQEFESRLLFAGGGFNTDDPGSLLDVLAKARSQLGADAQLVHYFAVPPTAFIELTRAIGQHGLAQSARVVYEKPFGTSRKGFIELDKAVHAVLDESQIYRIDHFLGKEATQNLHTLRFANELFAAAWNRQHIASVQIDVPEQIGVTDRAVFYDSTGAVLDMLVTHLFQVAAEVAMERPASLAAEDLQAAREKTISAIRPLDPAEVVLGQFEGYRELRGVRERSRTETFVAARLWIDNDRWRDVPFMLRTGKRMHASYQRVSVVFRPVQGPFADLVDGQNVLSFEMSGNGQIELDVLAKRPGPKLTLEGARVQLSLADLPDAEPLAPYVRLIHDVLVGDRSLFTRPDGLRAVWEVADPLLSAREDRAMPLPYAPGSWGPHAAVELIAPDRWLLGQ